MLLSIKHVTEYTFETPVEFALQRVKLRPLDSAVQMVADWQIDIDGGKVETSYKDHFANHVDLVSAERGTQKLAITATGTVETRDSSGVFGKVYGRAPVWLFAQTTELTTAGPHVQDLSKTLSSSQNTLDGLHDLSAEILKQVPYETGHTQSSTDAETAIEIGKGVCQDHANIFVSAARCAGLSARYVSGYLMMDDRVNQDASHAWAEVHLPNLGWVGFDVSNGMSPDERYVRIAIGRDAHDAAPIYGLRGGAGGESLIVSLQVQQ